MTDLYETLPFLKIKIYRGKPESSILLRLIITITVLVSVLAVLREESWPSWGWWNMLLILAGSWISWVRKDQRNWLIRLTLAVFMVGVGIKGISEIWNTPFDPRVPLANLLIHLLVIHCFDMPTRKDLNYSLLVSLILMALAAVFSNDLVFGMSLILFCILAIVSLTLASSREGEDISDAGFRTSRTQSMKPILQVSLLLGSITLLGCFLLFLFVPRLQSFTLRVFPVSLRIPPMHFFHGRVANPAYPSNEGLGGRQSLFSQRLSKIFNPDIYFGFNAYLDLSYRGELSNKIVMKVKSQSPGYWRSLVFDRYDGQGWSVTDVKPQTLNVSDSYAQLSYDLSYPQFQSVLQTFTIVERLPNLLPALYQPVGIYFPSSTLYRDNDDDIRLPFFLEPGTVYTVVSHVPDIQSLLALLRNSTSNYPRAISAEYLELPSQFPERLRQLAEKITANQINPYDKASAILNWLHQFPYTLDIPSPPPGEDAVEHFIFTLKRGYCEQFASAFAVLARAVGIPTRVVTGYATGDYNPFIMSYEVRAKHAHAWDEVYFSGVGWIPFDPSPPYSAIPISPERFVAYNFTSILNYLKTAIQIRFPRLNFIGLRWGMGVIQVLAGILIMLILWKSVYFWRGLIKPIFKKENSKSSSKHRFAKMYFNLEKILAKQGRQRHPAETPFEFISSFKGRIYHDSAKKLVSLYLQGRFSGDEATGAMVAQAQSLLKQIRNAVLTHRF